MTGERAWRIVQSVAVLIVFNFLAPFAALFAMLKQDLPPTFFQYVADVREIWADFLIAMERNDGENYSD